MARPIVSHLTDKEHIHAVKTAANYLPDMTLLCIMFKDIQQDKTIRIYMFCHCDLTHPLSLWRVTATKHAALCVLQRGLETGQHAGIRNTKRG